jgi:integrase
LALFSQHDQRAETKKRLAGDIKTGKDKAGKDKLTSAVRSRSVGADLRLFNTMLIWATTVRIRGGRRLLGQNPLAGLRTPHEKNPQRPVASWERFEATRKAIQQLTEESESNAERRKWLKLELALVIAEATGRRLGSIRQLAWEDIDFTRDTILWRADTDKKGKAWTVPMPATLRDEIKSFRVRLGSAFGSLVFPSQHDANVPVCTEVFSNWLRAAEKKANLPKLDGSLWHAYRRGSATSRKHLPTADVAAAGGWSDVTTLIRCYQQVDDDTLLRVMNEPRKVMERAKSG